MSARHTGEMVSSRVVEPSRRSLVLAAALLLAVTFSVYAGVVDHDFVGYDDGVYVSENSNVLAGFTGESLEWAFTSGYAGNWHPLTWVSLMLDVDLFGVNPGAMARTNVVLHGLTSVAVLLFAARMTGAFWPSVLVALLFALHPLRVESVAWIAERKDVLSGLFWMMTLLAWGRYVRNPGTGRYALVLLSFACGLMSKPVLVTLPFVLLLLDVWPLRRGTLGGVGQPSSGLGESLGWRALVCEKTPLFVLAAVASAVTLRVQAAGGAMRGEGLSPVDERLANAITSYVGYLGKTIWPVDLACFYPLPPNSADASSWTLAVLASGILLLGITGLAWNQRDRAPWLGVGWLWYLGTLVPMIGIVQVGNQSMADRYAYLPTIGVYLILAGALQAAGPHRAKVGSIALGLLAAVSFAILTPKQVAVWRDGEALFKHALEVTDGNYLAHYNLGTRYVRGRPRRLSEARTHLEAAVHLHPDHAGAQLNLGAVEWLEGNTATAEAHFERAVRLDAENPEAHLSLGSARFAAGKGEEAIRHFEIALALEPTNAPAWSNLGTVYLALEQPIEAATAFERALAISPGDPTAGPGLVEARRQERAAETPPGS
jgi:protein O-mannosyl-transferase